MVQKNKNKIESWLTVKIMSCKTKMVKKSRKNFIVVAATKLIHVLKKCTSCTCTVEDKSNIQKHFLQDKNGEKNPGKN